MKSKEIEKLLSGGDLRSIGKNQEIIEGVNDQEGFDALFKFLYHEDSRYVLRSADAIEKITVAQPGYLDKHKKAILKRCKTVNEIGLQWHLALLLPRLKMDSKEMEYAWAVLTKWARDKSNSRIVRVNSIQGLYELVKKNKAFKADFVHILAELEKGQIASILARIRRLKNEMSGAKSSVNQSENRIDSPKKR